MRSETEESDRARLDRKPYRIAPQAGPQENFCRCNADIAGTGGSRGGGKSIGLLLDPIYDVHRPGFSAVLFRRTYPEIMQEGGLWDSSVAIRARYDDPEKVPFYPALRAEPIQSRLEWQFPSGATVRFSHMETEKDRLRWLGAQVPMIGVDQLETFEENQWWDLLGCNRSDYGGKVRMRFTCNPHPDSFLRELLRWWIDDLTGLPILERRGKTRWFARLGNEIVWSDTRAEVIRLCGSNTKPLSFAFFPSTVFDNPILLQGDPGYVARLEGLPYVERERMLGGNWNIRETAGTMFKREWFKIVDAAPPGEDCRYWDRASTEAPEGKVVAGASFTAGARVRHGSDGRWYLMDMARGQWSPLGVEKAMDATASQDGTDVMVGIEVDPGQAGKVEGQMHARRMIGYNTKLNPVHDPKAVRSRVLRSQVEAGNFLLVRGSWNETFITECVNYDGTGSTLSDQVDSTSGGVYLLSTARRAGTWGRR